MSANETTHLPGLNGIRAIAASIVLFWHTDQMAGLFGLEPLGYSATGMAGSAVTMFFVLSGFLITLLLLKERRTFGSIDVPKFYARRILRIWPVYYTCVLISVILLRHLSTELSRGNWPTSIALYLLFMPNVAYAFHIDIRSIGPLWSVGVEEQFYLVWPWVMRRANNVAWILWAIIIGFMTIKAGFRFMENGPFYKLLRLTAIDSMAVGGLVAWMADTRHPALRHLQSRPAQIVSWSFLLVGICYRPLQVVSLFDSELHAVFYACIILNVSMNPSTMVRLENPLANFIGRLSYGLYAYHMPCICVLAHFGRPYLPLIEPAWLRTPLVIIATYVAALGAAWVSYRLLESRFLALKGKMAKIHSSDAPPVKSDPNKR